MRSMRWGRKAAMAMLTTGALGSGLAAGPVSAQPVTAASAVPVAVRQAASVNWLATRAYFNDARATSTTSNVTRTLVTYHFDHAATGSIVRVTTWNLTDTAISGAMIRALHRGVTLRVIAAASNCDATVTQDL